MPLTELDPLFLVLIVAAFGMAFARIFASRLRAVADEGWGGFTASPAAGPSRSADENEFAESAGLPPHRTTSPGRYALIFGVVGLFAYCVHEGISLDRLVKDRLLPPAGPAPATLQRGNDWAVIDGVRWFRLVGTDSAGIGYDGWVSEYAFHQALPSPTGDGDIFQKMGLPSIKERIEAARRLRQTGEALKQALDQR